MMVMWMDCGREIPSWKSLIWGLRGEANFGNLRLASYLIFRITACLSFLIQGSLRKQSVLKSLACHRYLHNVCVDWFFLSK